MKEFTSRTLVIGFISGAALSMSVNTFANPNEYDWSNQDAEIENEIDNSNYGAAAGFYVQTSYVRGAEYYSDADLVCVDYTVAISKTRSNNKTGRGKEQSIDNTETITMCQPIAT